MELLTLSLVGVVLIFWVQKANAFQSEMSYFIARALACSDKLKLILDLKSI